MTHVFLDRWLQASDCNCFDFIDFQLDGACDQLPLSLRFSSFLFSLVPTELLVHDPSCSNASSSFVPLSVPYESDTRTEAAMKATAHCTSDLLAPFWELGPFHSPVCDGLRSYFFNQHEFADAPRSQVALRSVKLIESAGESCPALSLDKLFFVRIFPPDFN